MSRPRKTRWRPPPPEQVVGYDKVLAGAKEGYEKSETVRLNVRIEPTLRELITESALLTGSNVLDHLYLLLASESLAALDRKGLDLGTSTPNWNGESRSVGMNIIVDKLVCEILKTRAATEKISLSNYIRAIIFRKVTAFLKGREKRVNDPKLKKFLADGLKQWSPKPLLTGIVTYHHAEFAEMVKKAALKRGLSVASYHLVCVIQDLQETFGKNAQRVFDEQRAVERQLKWDRIKQLRMKR